MKNEKKIQCIENSVLGKMNSVSKAIKVGVHFSCCFSAVRSLSVKACVPMNNCMLLYKFLWEGGVCKLMDFHFFV